jgi:hypothetical protein
MNAAAGIANLDRPTRRTNGLIDRCLLAHSSASTLAGRPRAALKARLGVREELLIFMCNGFEHSPEPLQEETGRQRTHREANILAADCDVLFLLSRFLRNDFGDQRLPPQQKDERIACNCFAKRAPPLKFKEWGKKKQQSRGPRPQGNYCQPAWLTSVQRWPRRARRLQPSQRRSWWKGASGPS